MKYPNLSGKNKREIQTAERMRLLVLEDLAMVYPQLEPEYRLKLKESIHNCLLLQDDAAWWMDFHANAMAHYVIDLADRQRVETFVDVVDWLPDTGSGGK